MPERPVKFYQVGSFVVGNRLLDPKVRTGNQNGPVRTHSPLDIARCQGCGEALGAA